MTKLLGSQGHSPYVVPTTAVIVVAASDSQNAPTGRTSVSSTGIRASRPVRSPTPPPWPSTQAISIARAPAAPTIACRDQAAYSRLRPFSLRRRRPAGSLRGSGR